MTAVAKQLSQETPEILAQGRHRNWDKDTDRGSEPERTCAVTREVLTKDRLIRFVADPDGTVIPDLGARLPGRGVWVTASRAAIEEAVKRKVFARSLKAMVRIPADLADRVGDLLERRALDALSLANKAGLITCGFQQVDSLLDKGAVAVLLHARDAAPGGVEKLNRKFDAIARAGGSRAEIVRLFTITQMSLAIGRPNVVHAALQKGGATARFLLEAGRVARFRPAGLEVGNRSQNSADGSADPPDASGKT